MSDSKNNIPQKKDLNLLEVDAHRLVEGQHRSSTRKLVDSIQEHDILESMLEAIKPSLPTEECFTGLHYLLFTPFRYPPLEYGSRFGNIYERSLWYGALDLETAMAEVAYYRFHFLFGTSAKLENIETEHTSFIAEIYAKKGLNLTQKPFLETRDLISSPNSYSESRLLGSQMRELGVEAFLYFSARRKGNYINIALFSPSAFKKKAPKKNSDKHWDCLTTNNYVEFTMKTLNKKNRICFNLEEFLIDNHFPNL